jgi:hypothetical protein
MSTKYQLKKLNSQALDKLQEKAKQRSSLKPIKSWKLTCLEKVPAAIGRSISIEARDYIQALEHALYVAGFSLEKELKKA